MVGTTVARAGLVVSESRGFLALTMVTVPSLYKLRDNAVQLTAEPDECNPALDFLAQACELFYGTSNSGESMKCPHCQDTIAELWQSLYRVTDRAGGALKRHDAQLPDEGMAETEVRWMVCHNNQCHRLIVQIWRGSRIIAANGTVHMTETAVPESWFALPRRTAPRHVSELVPDEFKKDYVEASLILEDSPRMSAVLSRRILAELLKQYAGRNEYGIAQQIDNFLKEKTHPTELRKNLHILREMADFAAHTQRGQQYEIIDVDPEEAEWTLEVVDGLFDYFIVGPSRNAETRASFEKKMKRAGRKPIKPLPEDASGP